MQIKNNHNAIIARALLRNPQILIFDEAASNLDQHTAEQLAQTINLLKGKVTILFITHQLPKSLHVDEAIMLGKENNQTPPNSATQPASQTNAQANTNVADAASATGLTEPTERKELGD